MALAEIVREVIALTNRKQKLSADLKQVKADLAEVEEKVKEAFSREGIQRMSMDGRTVYLRHSIYARLDKDRKEQAHDALRMLGLGDMIKPKVHTGTLSSWVREQEKDRQGIPELPNELEGLVLVSDTVDVSVRKDN